MQRTHIVKSFDEELANLKAVLLELGHKCRNQVTRVFKAMAEPDDELVGEVIWQESEVNRLQRRVDALTVELLARRQPMAVDLRTIVSALKISLEFEQISDHVVSIARYSKDLSSFPDGEPLAGIEKMAGRVCEMLDRLLEALSVLDVGRARDILAEDRLIDDMQSSLMERFLLFMGGQPSDIRGSTSLLISARAWERIGDHIKNIAETIIYIATGHTESSQHPDGSPRPLTGC